jgi:mannonate dehydratase
MLHLNTSVPNCAVQEYSPPGDWMKDVIQFDHRIEDGYLLCSDAPGLGIDLNEKAAAAHPYSGSEAPRLHREDGSLNDW